EIRASQLDALLRLSSAMNAARDAFGPYLRRARVQAGVSLQTIVDATNVSQTLWEGVESNDLSKWPNGVFARALVKEDAKLVGLNADATVDEFCRCFPQGDRRAEPTMRASAEIVNHELEWQDHPPPGAGGPAGLRRPIAGRRGSHGRSAASLRRGTVARPPRRRPRSKPSHRRGCFQRWPG